MNNNQPGGRNSSDSYARFSGVKSGAAPTVGASPAQPNYRSGPSKARNYSRGLSRGGLVEGEMIGAAAAAAVTRMGKRAAMVYGQAKLTGQAVTGTMSNGFPTNSDAQGQGQGNSLVGGRSDVGSSQSWEPGDQYRALGPGKDPGSAAGTAYAINAASSGELGNPGPQLALPPGRQQVQFNNTLSADIQDGVSRTGGKTAGESPHPEGTHHNKQPRNVKRAGGNIEGTLGRRSFGGESAGGLFGPDN
jgi:hypothetical protein